jgi:hypothetical protein
MSIAKRLDLERQLPRGRLARAGVIAALVLGGMVATGLTVLIVVFLVTALRS